MRFGRRKDGRWYKKTPNFPKPTTSKDREIIFDLAMKEPDYMEKYLKELAVNEEESVRNFRRIRQNKTYDKISKSNVDLNFWHNFLSSIDGFGLVEKPLPKQVIKEQLFKDQKLYNISDRTVREVSEGIDRYYKYLDSGISDEELDKEWQKYLNTQRVWLERGNDQL